MSKTRPTTKPELPTLQAQPLRVGLRGASQILGISRARIYQHISSGKLKGHRDGKRRLFTMVELQDFVTSSTNDQQAAAES